jgi:hypothetical protein
MTDALSTKPKPRPILLSVVVGRLVRRHVPFVGSLMHNGWLRVRL